ncbi:hypothetical protein [Sanguibacter suaedae]|uniref:Uncharacterized protein n=1 Tax=Sanguibacter suaedae TaxID=2795737 RepID=A0A934M9Y1_9MICO|nr:hypothetical protein [Sanguibacter suaedae]MBI9113651.1 hypothetical protein [Sanguibacter suaedae]
MTAPARTAPDRVGPLRTSLASSPWAVPLGVFVLSAVTWFGWFAHKEYVISPEGNQSGPYATWQAVGAVATLAVLALVAAYLLRPRLVAACVASGFTTGFAVEGLRSDESGLWIVGAGLVLVGTFSGAAFLASTVARRRGGASHA